MRVGLLLFVIMSAGMLSSCGLGGNGPCAVKVTTVSPSEGKADHSLLPPGNAQQFLAFQAPKSTKPECAVAQYIINATDQVHWTVSDAAAVSISNGNHTNGLATCKMATTSPVTVTATAPDRTVGTATMTCN